MGNSWIGIPKPIGSDNYITDIKEEISGKLFFRTFRTGLYEIDLITSFYDDNNILCKSYQLRQNYPNPFNPLIRIKFSFPRSGIVLIKFYDILRKEVQTLLNEYKQTGSYEIEFDGSKLTRGVYFARMISGSYSKTKKMVIIR